MRHDMFKVIVERPRRRRLAEACVPKGRVRDPEDLPSYEGMKAGRRRGWNRKELNENLNPLRRFLESRVGRPWNDVFSEICSGLSVNSTVQKHVRDHVPDYVDIDCRRAEDGRIVVNSRFGRIFEAGQLYVDPDSGILCRRPDEPSWRRRQDRSDPDIVEIAPDKRLHRIDGIWYEVDLCEIPENRSERIETPDGVWKTVVHETRVYDVVKRASVTRSRHFFVDNRYAVAKRPLSKKELRAHGVANDMDLHAARAEERRRKGTRG